MTCYKYVVGYAGLKKENQLKKITPFVLGLIKSIAIYSEYDLNNDHYPKVVCREHYNALLERSKPKLNEKPTYRCKLPTTPPPFSSIPLLRTTRKNPLGFDMEIHECFLCDQNKVGRPVKNKKNTDQLSNARLSSKYLCSNCFQIIIDTSLTCPASYMKTVENITSVLDTLPVNMKDAVIHKMIKTKIQEHSDDIQRNKKATTLNIRGNQTVVCLNPPESSIQIIPIDTLNQIKT